MNFYRQLDSICEYFPEETGLTYHKNYVFTHKMSQNALFQSETTEIDKTKGCFV
ncbi:hypothetical protein C1A50_3856 [Paenibacillus polymyxa]|nr:hypothetical protein C1A50_3856 [Paenibacillus polymyxa]